MKKLIIVGSGFAGLNAAKKLRSARDLEIMVIDRENHHLFQPLLYQVAMAALSPAEIARPDPQPALRQPQHSCHPGSRE